MAIRCLGTATAGETAGARAPDSPRRESGRDNCGIHPPRQGTSETTTDWHFFSRWQTRFFLSYLAALFDSTSPSTPASVPLAFLWKPGQNWASLLIAVRSARPCVFTRPCRGCTEPSLLTFELQRDQVQLEFPALRLKEAERLCRRESERGGKGERRGGRREGEGGEKEGGREGRDRERARRERGCNLLPESRTALQIPLLQHAGRMQVREGTDSAAENPNLGTARCARFDCSPYGRMVAAVSGGGFVTNDLAQSC